MTEKKRIKHAKKRSASSRQWLLRHINDPFVQQAQQQGLRSRGAFKLQQIQDKFKLIKPGACVVDIGCAPGGWSQVAQPWVGRNGTIVGVDLLEIAPLPHVQFIQGDFTAADCQHRIIEALNGQPLSVLLSDMAPNTCGIAAVDHLRIMALLEEIVAFACQHLAPNGCLVAKFFQGGTEKQLLAQLKQRFAKIAHFKPQASRSASTELYLVAQGFRVID